jgi:hypothetical protein
MDLIEGGVNDPINHWYYRHKYWFVRHAIQALDRHDIFLTDIGAGSALFSRELLREKLVNEVVAVDSGYNAESTDLLLNISYSKILDVNRSNVLLLTDVLEHIYEDQEFLTDIATKASLGADFIITVPAHISLWSGHDVYLKHFRRYDRKQLTNLVINSGLELMQIRYIYSILFPVAFLQRKFYGQNSNRSQMREHPKLISRLLSALLLIDRCVPHLPFGVSLFAVAKKAG